MPPIAYLKRRATFCAAHRLHSPLLSDADNAAIFGKCNNPRGHGHNYTVTITVKGEVDRVTGMVVNLVHVKSSLMNVIEQLDHRNLDEDVPFFKDRVSTTENLAVFIWHGVKVCLSTTAKNCELVEVEVQETENNSVVFRGEESPDAPSAASASDTAIASSPGTALPL